MYINVINIQHDIYYMLNIYYFKYIFMLIVLVMINCQLDNM